VESGPDAERRSRAASRNADFEGDRPWDQRRCLTIHSERQSALDDSGARTLRIVKGGTGRRTVCETEVPQDCPAVTVAVAMMPMENGEKQRQLSVLLVDDDAELCGMMREFFAHEGHHLECVYNGREGLTAALNGSYDLVILDVMLPVLDGFEVLQRLRRRKDLPIIMLTARVQQKDRIRGLDSGADDYLPKPFDPDELLARVRAVLRRSESMKRVEAGEIVIGNIRVNPTTREAWLDDELVELTATEFDLLEMLMRSAGRAVSRDEITAALFEREATPYDRFLDVHISHLRKKLEGGRSLIRTVRGVGYVFTGAA
jgi:DNA-binding response OmpR family regulator